MDLRVASPAGSPLRLTSRRAARPALAALLLAGATAVHAAETTADWLKRILDPATVGVTPFPGSTLNRKITVDTIRYDRDAPPTKKIAIYMAPVDHLEAAAKHFEQTLGAKPAAADTDTKGFKRWLFAVPAKGLSIKIYRSPWVDGMVQIEMEHLPPGS